MPRVKNNTKTEELIIAECKILLALKSLNISKFPGPDEIGARLLEELSKSVYHPIRTLIETSIQTASIPNDWKEGKMSAIYKKRKQDVDKQLSPS